MINLLELKSGDTAYMFIESFHPEDGDLIKIREAIIDRVDRDTVTAVGMKFSRLTGREINQPHKLLRESFSLLSLDEAKSRLAFYRNRGSIADVSPYDIIKVLGVL